jgi:hypothetical protein
MQEYQRMFQLSDRDLAGSILGCGDGPASFNAEMSQLGRSILSCDPIYDFTAIEIQNRFEASLEEVLSQVQRNSRNYVWSYHRNLDDLRQARQEVMKRFVADFAKGLAEGRYVIAELPRLPFEDRQFDLALCSHLLFLYSDLLSLKFHVDSICELCRVAREARIFPLTALNCELSIHLEPLMEQLSCKGLGLEIVTVNYQLQRNGNQMMRVWTK